MTTEAAEGSVPGAVVPSTGRRESTRTRKPSSRLLPSPSPPPPRSSSYATWMKNRESAATKEANVFSNATAPPTSSNSASLHKRSISNADAIVPDASQDVATAGSGKRKRRPSTMTKPPSTITESFSAPSGLAANGIVAPPKTKLSRKSSTPERTNANAQSSKKPKKILKVKVESDVTLPHSVDQMSFDAGNVSDTDERSASMVNESNGPSEDRKGGVRVWSARRSYPTASALEPPPLISRRGGIKGCNALPRAASSRSHTSTIHSTPPRSELWSHPSNGMSMPLLRFKLDNIVPRSAEEDEESAAEEEDDFHVAMLDAAKYFDNASDIEEDVPTASVKSSPRASRGYDDSDAEDTPATTPQSPQSVCDPSDRCSGNASENEDETVAQKDTDESAGSSKVVRDNVFAHALEPSSTRPYTHAGSLTLSLPFDEMPQLLDEDGAPTLRKTPNAKTTSSLRVKLEDGQDNEAIISEDDVFNKSGQGVTEELLETSMAGSIDPLHRHAALLLSSPHPMSAFASPTLTSTTVAHAKAEPSHLSLPPVAALSDDMDEDIEVSRASVSTDYSSADEHLDDEEHEELGKQVADSNPENMCLLELEETWEQGENGGKRSYGASLQRQDEEQEEARTEPTKRTEVAVEASKKSTKRQKALPSNAKDTRASLAPQVQQRATRSVKQSQGRSLRSRN